MSQVAAHGDTSAFYRALGLVLQQYDGLRAGYEAASTHVGRSAGDSDHDDGSNGHHQLSTFDFQMLNGVGDLFDLIPAVYPSLRKDFTTLPVEEIEK